LGFESEIVSACDAAYYSAILKRAVGLDEFKKFCHEFAARYNDSAVADEALLDFLLEPYRRKA
jgi:hypothetical protein